MSIKHVVRWGPFLALVMLVLGTVSWACEDLALLFLSIGVVVLAATAMVSATVVAMGGKS